MLYTLHKLFKSKTTPTLIVEPDEIPVERPKHINIKYIDPNNKLVVIDWYDKKQIVVIPESLTVNVTTGGYA